MYIRVPKSSVIVDTWGLQCLLSSSVTKINRFLHKYSSIVPYDSIFVIKNKIIPNRLSIFNMIDKVLALNCKKKITFPYQVYDLIKKLVNIWENKFKCK